MELKQNLQLINLLKMENKLSYWEAPIVLYKKDVTRIKTDNIIEDVCKVYQIELSDLMSNRRFRELVEPRQVLFYILHKKLKIKSTKVGKMFVIPSLLHNG